MHSDAPPRYVRAPVTSPAWAQVEWAVRALLTQYPTMAATVIAEQPGTVRVNLPTGFPRDENLDRDLYRMLSDEQIASELSKLRRPRGRQRAAPCGRCGGL